MQTAIINNREAIVSGQLKSAAKDSSGMPILGELVSFIPGLNLIDSTLIKKLREENKAFDAHFKNKISPSKAPEQNPEKVGLPVLRVHGKELDDVRPFAKVPDAECLVYIEEMLSVPELKKWLAEEPRGDVRLGLMKKIELLTNPDADPAE